MSCRRCHRACSGSLMRMDPRFSRVRTMMMGPDMPWNGNYIHYSLDTCEGVNYITVISKGDTQMTVEQKKQKILAAIASRGWFTAECYWNEARALEAEGLIRLGDRFFTGGNRKPVWVAA